MELTIQKLSLIARQKIETPKSLSLGAKIGTGLARMWSSLTGSSRRLLDLNATQATNHLLDYKYVGVQSVLLGKIRGSATTSRCYDFDVNFRPLRNHSKTRLEGIAAARRRGVKMPPVALIQVGEIYFVEDGHHRISVARALGQTDIEAEVRVWQ